jgi:hypothetical protein
MKKTFTLLALAATTTLAYSWDYLGAKGTGNGEDFEIASNGDVYVADYDAGLTGSNILLRVKKYNGSSWSDLPNASEGAIIGTAVDIELNGSDVYVGYAEFKNSAYNVTIKKFETDKWVQISTVLKMPIGGASIFDLVVDPDGVCYVLGAAGPSSTTAKIHKLVNNDWTAITIPNAQGPTFHDRSSYIDANKDLIFPTSKAAFVSGAIVYEITVHKLSGTTVTTVGTSLTTANGGVYNKLRALADGTLKLITSDNFKNTFYTLGSGAWNVNAIETTIGVTVNADIDANGKWYFANSAKIFEEGNATAIYEPSSVVVADIKVYDGYIYALLNDGVIKQPLGNANGINGDFAMGLSSVVYPNPTSEKLYLKSRSSTYSIFDVLGNLVGTGNTLDNSIPVAHLESGVYHLQLTGIDNTRLKFVKQ